MQGLTRLACIAGAACALPQGVTAQESFVACPVTLLDTAVVSALPEGWWATPQRGELLSTEIRTVGGQQTLVCNYAAFGTAIPVMREAPASSGSCSPTPGGFACGAGASTNDGKEVSGRVSGPSAPVRSDGAPVPPPDRVIRPLKE